MIDTTEVIGVHQPGGQAEWQAYHAASRFYPGVSNTRGDELSWLSLERQAREYPACEQLDFTPGRAASTRSDLAHLLHRRRSTRVFTGQRISKTLLDEAFGHGFAGVDHGEETPRSRPSPSAGRLLPVELYLAGLRIDGLPDGLYHLAGHPRRARAAWERLRLGIDPRKLDGVLLGQLPPGAAGVAVLTATVTKAASKYGERAYRFCLLEAGHVAQSLTLIMAACGIASVCLGGFADRLLDGELLVDGVDEVSLYAIAFGIAATEGQDTGTVP
jgi:SagB-type dehydrogenase family enzyme